ncbi:DUF559 domain-containing protein [Herbidospora sp. RD11066]
MHLAGIDADAIELSFDSLPVDAPAIVTYSAGESGSVQEMVEGVLRELEILAVALFPAWLPEGDKISDTSSLGRAAVRSLAARLAAGSRHFGPFLADLAERSLRRDPEPSARFPAEARAAGLARVLASAFRRERAVLVVYVPEGLSPHGETVLVAGCEWLAYRAAIGVWLVGPEVRRVESVQVRVREEVVALVRELPPRERETQKVYVPPIAGRPHPFSWAEQTLEKALRECAWARGRAWNQTYPSVSQLSMRFRPDLMWSEERCVVEIDGPEHRGARQSEYDRWRDAHLEKDGYTVFRFTNEQIESDLLTIVRQIEKFLCGQRSGTIEGDVTCQPTG